MDIISIILKQLSGLNSLIAGYIVLAFIIFKLRSDTKKDVEIQKEIIENVRKEFVERIDKIDKEIMGFMMNVNESIKEERKLNYQVMNGVDREIHDVLKKLGECVGELRNKEKVK